MSCVRTANRALILEGDRLLVTVSRADGAEYYLLPGGGQEVGEDRITSLRRECREEIGCDVVVEGLAVLRSYIGANHRRAAADRGFHQEEALWWCSLAPGAVPGQGVEPDHNQQGVAWMSIAELTASGRFCPGPLLEWLGRPPGDRPLYLGDVF